MTIQAIIEKFARDTPEMIAIVFGSKQFTFAQLNQLANQRASILIKEGVKPGQAVAICADRSLDMVVNIVATLKTRAICTPINSDFSPPDRLTHIFSETKAAAIVGTREQLTKIPSGITIRSIAMEDDGSETKLEEKPNPVLDAIPTDIYAVTYTSGSTGTPKGVPNNQEAILKWLTSWVETLNMASGCRVAIHPNITFDAGFWDIFRGLLLGASAYLLDDATQKDPELLIKFINDNHITDITLPPSIIALIDPSKIRHPVKFVSTGAAFNPKIITTFLKHRHRLFNGYGPTEVGIGATLREIVKLPEAGYEVPIGHPIPGMEFWFRNPEHKGAEAKFHLATTEMEGELYIGGPGLTPGYLNRADLNEETFVVHPTKPSEKLYRTGDIIRRGADGEFYFIRRCKRSGKVCGQFVNPDASEILALGHEALAQAAVLICIDKLGNQRLVCYYTLKEGTRISLSEIRRHLATKLQEYEIPSLFIPLISMPLTSTGKIDYSRLPAPDSITVLRDTLLLIEPRNPLEDKLRQECAQMLGINPRDLGVKDNLLEMGLKSFWAMALTTRIADEEKEGGLGVKISYIDLITKYNTVEKLAAHIRQRKNRAAIEELFIQDGTKPVWCLPDVTGKADIYRYACPSITRNTMLGLNITEVDLELGLCRTLDDMATYWVNVIRTRQPKGPYCLIGYSFGASLAQKITYKLEKQGEIVETLHLIDIISPMLLQRLTPTEHADYFYPIINLLLDGLNTKYGSFYTVSLRITLIDLKKLTNIEQVKKAFTDIEIITTKENPRKREELERELTIFRTNLLSPFLEEKSSVERITCPTTLHYTEELVRTFPGNPTFGWEQLCEDIIVKRVRGNHITVMTCHAADWAPDIQRRISPPSSPLLSSSRPDDDLHEKVSALEKRLEEQQKYLEEQQKVFLSILETLRYSSTEEKRQKASDSATSSSARHPPSEAVDLYTFFTRMLPPPPSSPVKIKPLSPSIVDSDLPLPTRKLVFS